MIKPQKSQFGIGNKFTMSFSRFVPIQSPHLGNPDIMELEPILSKNGDQWSQPEIEFVFTEFFVNRNFMTVVKRRINATIPEFDRKDIEQDFYIYILRMMANFEPTRLGEDVKPINKFIAFLRRYLNDFCRSYYRSRDKERRTISYDQPVDEDSDQILLELFESDAISPEDETVKNQQREIINECISKLPPLQKRALILRYVKEKSYEEIAVIEKANKGAVRKRVFNAIENLHRCFEKNGLL